MNYPKYFWPGTFWLDTFLWTKSHFGWLVYGTGCFVFALSNRFLSLQRLLNLPGSALFHSGHGHLWFAHFRGRRSVWNLSFVLLEPSLNWLLFGVKLLKKDTSLAAWAFPPWTGKREAPWLALRVRSPSVPPCLRSGAYWWSLELLEEEKHCEEGRGWFVLWSLDPSCSSMLCLEPTAKFGGGGKDQKESVWWLEKSLPNLLYGHSMVIRYDCQWRGCVWGWPDSQDDCIILWELTKHH